MNRNRQKKVIRLEAYSPRLITFCVPVTKERMPLSDFTMPQFTKGGHALLLSSDNVFIYNTRGIGVKENTPACCQKILHIRGVTVNQVAFASSTRRNDVTKILSDSALYRALLELL